MDLRLYVEAPPPVGQALALPAVAARHVQTRRLQPGDPLLLFDGGGGEWAARVERIGRREVVVQVGARRPALAPPLPQVTLALGMPANERMDWLVEKATELGATAIQPLHCARSVLRLDEDRAARRGAHWRAIAAAAGEQCGRAWLPRIEPVRTLDAWLATLTDGDARRWLLCAPQPAQRSGEAAAPVRERGAGDARPVAALAPGVRALLVLSGPEGGLSPDEEQRARARLRAGQPGPGGAARRDRAAGAARVGAAERRRRAGCCRRRRGSGCVACACPVCCAGRRAGGHIRRDTSGTVAVAAAAAAAALRACRIRTAARAGSPAPSRARAHAAVRLAVRQARQRDGGGASTRPSGAWSAKHTRTSRPGPPGRSCSDTRAWCASATARTIARPSPLPPSARLAAPSPR